MEEKKKHRCVRCQDELEKVKVLIAIAGSEFPVCDKCAEQYRRST